MKHKVSDLEGALLDAAVAKAMGASYRIAEGPMGDPLCFAQGAAGGPRHGPNWKSEVPFCPSHDWEDGGPIIQRERICVQPPVPDEEDQPDDELFDPVQQRDEWEATICKQGWWNLGAKGCVGGYGTGPTPLIAAMRAYVASKFGEEVELP